MIIPNPKVLFREATKHLETYDGTFFPFQSYNKILSVWIYTPNKSSYS